MLKSLTTGLDKKKAPKTARNKEKIPKTAISTEKQKKSKKSKKNIEYIKVCLKKSNQRQKGRTINI